MPFYQLRNTVFWNLYQGGAEWARKFPDFLSQPLKLPNILWITFIQILHKYSHIWPHTLLWEKFTIYLGLLDYLTNNIHVVQSSRRRWASLIRTRKNILLRSLQMCFLPSRSYPEFEIVSSSQFVTIYRISLPSPARRVSMESQLPIDQSEKI